MGEVKEVETIGIPRALAYFSYYPFWKTVLEGLGRKLVESGTTTKAILDEGVSEACNDLCVPIKIFFGHVARLKGRADKIFVPRLVNVGQGDTFCPKFLGLPDMVEYGMADLPLLFAPRIDLRKKNRGWFELARMVAEALDCNIISVLRVLQQGRKAQAEYDSLLLAGYSPDEALELMDTGQQGKVSGIVKKPVGVIAVLGYPYSLYDKFLNGNLLSQLREMGIKVLTPEMVPKGVLYDKNALLPKGLFWHFSNRVLGAGMYYLSKGNIDGIIHVSNFACGPDAMVNKLLELEAKKYSCPFLTVSLDEHTGQAGIHTRLEAFVDMVRWRRQRACE
ncbi:MAG: acyl-CoA dehydratase activase-related protein [bacterium]|jgi:predicted nucleotide-binding protein (sugar kinase/HSP70/actin superfamily)|nr:acyl-CoA dehydratase activase-related protein [Bacillota bacterium]